VHEYPAQQPLVVHASLYAMHVSATQTLLALQVKPLQQLVEAQDSPVPAHAVPAHTLFVQVKPEQHSFGRVHASPVPRQVPEQEDEQSA
jgi:hypothetical protein